MNSIDSSWYNFSSDYDYSSESESGSDNEQPQRATSKKISAQTYLMMIRNSLRQKDGAMKFTRLLNGRPLLNYDKLIKLIASAKFDALSILKQTKHYSQMDSLQKEKLDQSFALKRKVTVSTTTQINSASSSSANLQPLEVTAPAQEAVSLVLPERSPPHIQQLFYGMPDLAAPARSLLPHTQSTPL